MEWMEVIRIQITDEDKLTACREYLRQLEDMVKPHGLTNIQQYHHASITGFQAIILKWNTELPQAVESSVAAIMKYGLKDYGLVDYSTWVAPGP